MWGRIRALIRKELLAVLRDRRSRLVLVGPPLIQLLLFSYAATLDVTNVSIGILNRDAGRWGTELVQRLDGAATFSRIVSVRGVQEIDGLIDTRAVIAVVHVGPDFSRDVEAGRPARLQIVLDGRRSNAAQIVQGYLTRVVDAVSADIQVAHRGTAVPDAARDAAPDAIVERHWFNPNLDYQWFTVPSLIGVIALLISLVVTGQSVARERELGTFDQLLVSPLRVHEILIGKTVPPLLIGLFHATVFVLAAAFVFEVPLLGSVALLYASLVIYLASIIGVGLFISALAQTQQQAFLGSFLFTAPAVLLSGFASPVDNMPGWVQTLTLANPLRHFLVIVRGIFLKDLPAAEVLANALPLAAIAAITLGAAAWLFTRRLE